MEWVVSLLLVLTLTTEAFAGFSLTVSTPKAPYRVNLRNKYPNGGPNRALPIDLKATYFSTTPNPYTPALFTAGFLTGKKKPVFADNRISDYLQQGAQLINFNALDSKTKSVYGSPEVVNVNRESYDGPYPVELMSKYFDLSQRDPNLADIKIALNPTGPTGVLGRGELAKYGPNHAADIAPIRIAPKCLNIMNLGEIKNILECIEIMNITRKEGGDAAMCGGMVDDGEEPHVTMKREYLEEAFNLKGYALRIKMAKQIENILLNANGRSKIAQEEQEDLKAIIVHFFHNNKDVLWAISKALAVNTMLTSLKEDPLPVVPGLKVPASQLNIVKSSLAFKKLESERKRALVMETKFGPSRKLNLKNHVGTLIQEADVLLLLPQSDILGADLKNNLTALKALKGLGLREWSEYNPKGYWTPMLINRQKAIDKLDFVYREIIKGANATLDYQSKNVLTELVKEIKEELKAPPQLKQANADPDKLLDAEKTYQTEQTEINAAIEYVQGLISNADLVTRIPELSGLIAELRNDRDPKINTFIRILAQNVINAYNHALGPPEKVKEVKFKKVNDVTRKYEPEFTEPDVKKLSTLGDIYIMRENISVLKDALIEAEIENNQLFKQCVYEVQAPEIAERLIYLRKMIDIVQALEPLQWLTNEYEPAGPRISALKRLLQKDDDDENKDDNKNNVKNTIAEKLTLENVYTDAKDSFILAQLADEDRVEDIDLMDDTDNQLSDKMKKILTDFDNLLNADKNKDILLKDVQKIIKSGEGPLENRLRLAWVLAVEYEKQNIVWTVYAGFVDDWRNADLAWMETVCFLVIFSNEMANCTTTLMEAGDDAREVNWVPIEKNMRLYASHFRMVNRIVEYLVSSEIEIRSVQVKDPVQYYTNQLVRTPTMPGAVKNSRIPGLRYDFLYTPAPTAVV